MIRLTMPPLVFLVNIVVTSVLTVYSSLNLRPDVPSAGSAPSDV